MSFYFNCDTHQLFSYKTLTTYSLNKTASFVLSNYILGYQSLEFIANKLSADYSVEYQVIYNDLLDIVDELASIDGLLEWANSLKGQAVVDNWQLQTPIVHIIENCNSPCIMCDCWKAKRNYHSREKLNVLFGVLKQKGADSIMVSGGEPLLHPELMQIILDIHDYNMGVMLNTNGIVLHKHAWLYSMNIEQLVVSIDGVTEADYKYYRGSNAYQQVWKNIRNFKINSPSTQVGIRVTINAKNYNQIPKLIELAREHNVDAIGFSPADISSSSFARYMQDSGREEMLMQAMIPSEEELKNYLKNFYIGSYDYDVINENFYNGYLSWGVEEFIKCYKFYLSIRLGNQPMFYNQLCNFPRISMVVDYNGDLKHCFYSKAFGNLNDLDSVDWSFSNLYELIDVNKCASCRGQVFCG